MFQRGRLKWGLSARPITFGQKLQVVLWIYNPSEVSVPVWTCMEIDHFWIQEIQMVNSAGMRILSQLEQAVIDGPNQKPPRYTLSTLEIRGGRLGAGSKVLLCQAQHARY